MREEIDTISPYTKEELNEIRELFPELSLTDLKRLLFAMDLSIDQVLDHYFGQVAKK